MILTDILSRSSRSLLSARVRTLLTAFAIAVGAFALTLTLGASNGAQSYANTIVKDNFDPSELIVTADKSILDSTDTSKPQVYDANFGSVLSKAGAATQVKMLSDSDVARLQKIPGVESVRALNMVNLQYITRDGQKKYVGTAQAYSSYKSPELAAGAIPATLPDGSILLPDSFLSALGFKDASSAIGQQVRLAVQKQADQSTALRSLLTGDTSAVTAQKDSLEKKFTVAAVTKKPSTLVQPGTELNVTINSANLSTLSDFATAGTTSYHKYLSAYVKVADGTNTAKLHTTQALVKKAGYGAQSTLDTEKIITQVISVLQGIVSVFGLIAVIASVFGVVNTMYISVLQRTREIGLMKALGMHKKDISKLFLFEAGLIGFLGGVLGSGLAIILGTILNPLISRWLELGDQRLIQFSPGQVIVLVVSLTLVAIAAGLFPALKAARLDPIAALRTE